MDPDFDTEEHVVISDMELKRVHDEIDRLRAAIKHCGDLARSAFRGDLDESETLCEINNFVIAERQTWPVSPGRNKSVSTETASE